MYLRPCFTTGGGSSHSTHIDIADMLARVRGRGVEVLQVFEMRNERNRGSRSLRALIEAKIDVA